MIKFKQPKATINLTNLKEELTCAKIANNCLELLAIKSLLDFQPFQRGLFERMRPLLNNVRAATQTHKLR